ncbi:sensor histidine kinase [Streptosporangium pseudovulgare]|uniref:sensor histidine kinase n=1 Tax=Streptosporangium pseudovulgare TaxID=35765 RepID=UPI0016712970|nr:sensor histidine kinase [Streptosporangium pseudovulgare]
MITWSRGRAQQLRRIDTRVVDAALAVMLAVASFGSATQFSVPGWPPLDVLAFLLICFGNLPLLWRSSAPVAVLVVACVIWSVYLAIGYPPMASWASLVALYTVAARCSVKVSAVCLAAVGLLVLISGLLLLSAATAAAQTLAVLVVWAFGVDRRRLSVLSAWLRREQEDKAQRAITEERVRIARELHDIVAHHMSVVSVQAGLARYVFTSDPATARAALDTIATSSFEAQEEMRRLLAVLRTNGDDPAYAPAPGLARLNELADRVRAAGVPVELIVRGAPRPVGPGADQCVYRVVQESLTNVLKHAGPASAVVVLDYTATGLTVNISDDGAGRSLAGKSRNAEAHGLLGMRERARLYGGTVIAGPGAQGGFEVVFTLPLPGGRPDGEQREGTDLE